MMCRRARRPLRWGVIASVAMATCGCSTIMHMFHHDKAETQRAEQLQVLQFRIMRFADGYVGGISEPLQRFQASTDNAEDRLAAQNWKLTQSTAAYTIASGPSPVVNALDMVVLATLSRMVIDDAWISERFGERATPLRDAQRHLEEEARAIAKEVVTPDQFAQLQRTIDEWRRENPHIRAVSFVHFRDFANSIGHPSSGGEDVSLGSLFSLLGIDPLSGLDPAVREIAQSRELAERTIYYAQRLPNLLDMQVEQMTDQFAVTPESLRLLANIDRTARAAEETGRLASELPGVLASEREAAIRQFMQAIDTESAHTRSLITELRGTLEAGTATSNSLTTAIRAFDQLMAGFQKSAPAGAPPATPGRAFDITEYTAAAAEITRAADELKQLIAGIEQGSPGVMQSADRAAASLQGVVDHAYWRLVQLLGIILLGGLAVALMYRGIAARLPLRGARE
jgi:hypothetical protein